MLSSNIKYWPQIGDLVSYSGNEWEIISSNRATETFRLKLLHTKENEQVTANWHSISLLEFEYPDWNSVGSGRIRDGK